MKPHPTGTRRISSYLLSLALLLCALLLSTRDAAARDLIVRHTLTPSVDHYTTIQAALTYVSSVTPTTTSFRVVVQPSSQPYSGPITLLSNVPIIGVETARTFIIGGSTGATMTASNVTGVVIKNLTIITAATGIDISNNSAVTITNTIFQTGLNGTAINVGNLVPNAEIINCVFYQNGTAIRTGSDILITNNIFSNNNTAISSTVPLNRTSYNTYHGNGSNGNVTLDLNSLPNAIVTNPDPLFVAPAKRDFHLKAGSPSHAYSGNPAGNPSYPNKLDPSAFDMGAYGGPESDTIPVQVADVTSDVTSTIPPFAITVSWTTDTNYQVKGYNVHYGYAPGSYQGNDAVVSGVTVTSPVDVGNVTSITLDSLNPLSNPSYTTPLAPLLRTPLDPRDGKLVLNWSSVDKATKYYVYYALSSAPTLTFPPQDAGNTTSYNLTGLVNGTTYDVAIKAISQATYYIAVTAYTTTAVSSRVPGVSYESTFSIEQSETVGTALESPLSNVVQGTPERLEPYPNLPNTGCFIATAAYGAPDTLPVRILREFRDRRLLTHPAGRAVVDWYYRTSPALAAWLNEHPAAKPAVRMALEPVIATAAVITYAPAAVILAAVVLLLPVRRLLRRRTS